MPFRDYKDPIFDRRETEKIDFGYKKTNNLIKLIIVILCKGSVDFCL